MTQDTKELAERVRARCIEVALLAYEEGGISGLCAEGRWELAVQAMRCVDLAALPDGPAPPRDAPD
ncbi:MAG: acetyltransferase [Chromatiaceae bacterium]|nr:acetyltransferase [Gammaproteobacteria bacterium]MCP5300649.1 acetyltransferase [Chromatiaceae bacterium]MCP5422721.1 acetyltransferase [Chromatiaceae bacterium]